MNVTLRCVFKNVSGDKVVMSWPNADSGSTDAQVKNLMQTITANRDIFNLGPAEIVGAEFVSRSVRAVDVE